MKNNFLFLLSVITFVIITACSGEKKGGPMSDVLAALGAEKMTFEDRKKYFTPGTVSVVERAVASGSINRDDRIQLLPLFSEKIKWIVVDQKSEGDSGNIRIKYIEHPVENIKGFEMDLRMIKSGGTWKIDLEREIKDRFR